LVKFLDMHGGFSYLHTARRKCLSIKRLSAEHREQARRNACEGRKL
jgi:hypothetical protein